MKQYQKDLTKTSVQWFQSVKTSEWATTDAFSQMEEHRMQSKFSWRMAQKTANMFGEEYVEDICCDFSPGKVKGIDIDGES